MKLTKSDIAMIDELIDSRKNAIDAQSKMIVDECIKFKNNQDCNKTLIKNALVILRSEKKIQAYRSKIDAQEKHQSAQDRKNKSREKFLVGNAFVKIFADASADVMLKLIAISQSTNEKDREFLLKDVDIRTAENGNLVYDWFDEKGKNHQLQIKKVNAKTIEYICFSFDDRTGLVEKTLVLKA